MLNPMDMTGRAVIVTGAGQGIGRAISVMLLGLGGDVVMVERNPDTLRQTAAELDSDRLMPVEGDVSDPAFGEKCVSQAVERFGAVHGLVNNAGITWRSRLDEVKLEDWDRVLRINLTSAMLGIQAITPLMTDGGSVVNISSRAGLSGHFTVAYTTAKWGLRGLSRVASMELGPKGIRCNCLFPGYIDTPMVRTAPEAFVEASLKEIPMGRKGTPDDIAPLVVYLISDESTYVNGTEISVDGGEWAHGGTKVYSDLLRGMDVRNG
jgi:3alpha(or 20beta)-hydroxysteroid dehydrogenase